MKKELDKISNSAPPITSKAAGTVGKLALHYITYYEEVVELLMEFIRNVHTEHKISGLYLIDGLVKNANRKLGKENNYTLVFTHNLRELIENAFQCTEEDKPKVARVVRIWIEEDVFPFLDPNDVEQPVLDQLKSNAYYQSLNQNV
eukprot:TRINITY_DN10192_c0_g1_i1.p1 TRINITY_DN10192_c0_g1~~TRINITY_DN10192_c0_g1_i1.p1  ORF type:complete len:166 (+),score=25.99 TRINITY_DN10192_c0_g1_i1:63-500(+)